MKEVCELVRVQDEDVYEIVVPVLLPWSQHRAKLCHSILRQDIIKIVVHINVYEHLDCTTVSVMSQTAKKKSTTVRFERTNLWCRKPTP